MVVCVWGGVGKELMVCYFCSVSRLLIWYDLSQRRRNNKLYLLLLKTDPLAVSPFPQHGLSCCCFVEDVRQQRWRWRQGLLLLLLLLAVFSFLLPPALPPQLLSEKLNTQDFFFPSFFIFFLPLPRHQLR